MKQKILDLIVKYLRKDTISPEKRQGITDDLRLI